MVRFWLVEADGVVLVVGKVPRTQLGSWRARRDKPLPQTLRSPGLPSSTTRSYLGTADRACKACLAFKRSGLAKVNVGSGTEDVVVRQNVKVHGTWSPLGACRGSPQQCFYSVQDVR